MYAIYSISVIWAKIADVLQNRADDDFSVEAWIRQQGLVRAALARASSENPPATRRRLDNEWVEPWVKQQTRLREAIARAKSKNEAIEALADSDDEWANPWSRQQSRLRNAIAQASGKISQRGSRHPDAIQ